MMEQQSLDHDKLICTMQLWYKNKIKVLTKSAVDRLALIFFLIHFQVFSLFSSRFAHFFLLVRGL